MTNNNDTHWNSRWVFILAATGSAVGLGNIWKFPYITGEYGGGAFVIVYLACIFALGIPVMMAEVMLGRSGRANPVQSMLKLSEQSRRSRYWSIIGVLGIISGLMILAFYSVIAGWSVEYVFNSVQGSFNGQSADTIDNQFAQLLSDPIRLSISHTLFIIVTGAVVSLGVTKGLENAVRILMPLLFVLLIVLIGFSMTQGDASTAFDFLFKSDFSKLTSESVLVALGHAFFTLSLGMGAIMVYGAYMPGNTSIAKTVMTVAALDTFIALGAGMAIFPLVFAHSLEASEGPGLLFVTLPIAFSNMPGGVFFGTLFFTLVAIAGLSSAISILEPGVAWLENRGLSRSKSTFLLGTLVWAGGMGCIFSNNWLKNKPEDNYYFFETLDHIASNIFLPLGGLLIAIFVGWIMKQSEINKAIRIESLAMYNCWIWVLRLVAPAGILIVFAHSLKLI